MYTPLTTVDDMQGYSNNIHYSESTRPTRAQVESWIDQGTAVLYSFVGQRYVLPITNETDLLVLQGIVERYVLEHINYVLVRNGKIVIEDGKMPTSVNLYEFNKTCENITNGKLVLLGSTQMESSLGLSNPFVTGTYTKTFKKDADNW